MITETIYIAIQGARPPAWCPVQAARRADGTFQILSRNDDPESEPWEFSPGSVVRCEQQLLGSGMQWVAVAYVPPWPAPRQVWPG